MATAALVVAALVGALAGAATAAGAVAPAPVRLAAPGFPAAAAGVAGSGGLKIVSTRRNKITDAAAWVRANGLDLGEYDVGTGTSEVKLPPVPAWAPRSLAGARLVRAVRSGRTLLLVYGADFASGRLLAAYDTTTHARRYAFDLAAWAFSPPTRPADRSLAYQEIRWAVERDGVLYVESTHSTYAATSGGRTAYITAIAVATRRVLWRSPALVGNAETFVLAGSSIVAGYGFTREPDYLTVLDVRTGTPRGRVALRSAPEFIVLKGGRLYVRTYDTDVVATLAAAAG